MEATVLSWEEAAHRLKPDLLRWVEELAADPQFVKAIPAGGRDREKLGDNQWRSLVAAAREAQTMEELKVLLRYKVGKDLPKPKGWGIRLTDGRYLGLAVVDILDRIRQQAMALRPGDEAERLALDAAARFFGYMAWKAVSLRAQEGGEGA